MKVYYGELYCGTGIRPTYTIDGCYAVCAGYVYKTLGTMPDKIKITVALAPHEGYTEAKSRKIVTGNGVLIDGVTLAIHQKAFDIIKEVSPVTKTVYFKIEEAK